MSQKSKEVAGVEANEKRTIPYGSPTLGKLLDLPEQIGVNDYDAVTDILEALREEFDGYDEVTKDLVETDEVRQHSYAISADLGSDPRQGPLYGQASRESWYGNLEMSIKSNLRGIHKACEKYNNHVDEIPRETAAASVIRAIARTWRGFQIENLIVKYSNLTESTYDDDLDGIDAYYDGTGGEPITIQIKSDRGQRRIDAVRSEPNEFDALVTYNKVTGKLGLEVAKDETPAHSQSRGKQEPVWIN